MTAIKRLELLLPAVKDVLRSKGIEDRYLHFGGELPVPAKITTPTDARSEFLANRAMGDWAEVALTAALNDLAAGFNTIHYGDSDASAAGEEGFKERYINSVIETLKFGKRPDLLLVEKSVETESDISMLPREKADAIARQAIAAIEVRSSKQQALKYMKVKAAEGKKTGKSGLSFTVKVEDLKIVYRWIEVCNVPQYYFQVFFDSVFAISVEDIFKTVASGRDVTFEKPDKSQNKATLMIPIAKGVQVGTFNSPVSFKVAIKENRLGRIDPYVVPHGGELKLNLATIKTLLGI